MTYFFLDITIFPLFELILTLTRGPKELLMKSLRSFFSLGRMGDHMDNSQESSFFS